MTRTVFGIFTAACITASLATAAYSGETLPRLTERNMDKLVNESSTPVFALVTDDLCKTCPRSAAFLLFVAPNHPDYKFVQADASEVGMSPKQAPGVVVFDPHNGQSYHQGNITFTEESLALFLQQRTRYFTRRAKLVQELSAATQEWELMAAPYLSEIPAIEAAAKEGLGFEIGKIQEALQFQSVAEERGHPVLLQGAEKKMRATRDAFNDAAGPYRAHIAKIRQAAGEKIPAETARRNALQDALDKLDFDELDEGEHASST
jgi:hypothetical protein